jgi:hypothetical protein
MRAVITIAAILTVTIVVPTPIASARGDSGYFCPRCAQLHNDPSIGSSNSGSSGICTRMSGSCAIMGSQLMNGLGSSIFGGGPTLGMGLNPGSYSP